MEDDKKWLRDIEKRVEEERKNYTGPHCCLAMDASLKDPETYLIYYNKKYREYTVDAYEGAGFKMKYCPICGKKLPKSLSNEWFDELSKILGFEVDISIDRQKIPHDFRTDEWWKKREL